MKKYYFYDDPIKVYGVPFFEQTKRLERLPEEIRHAVPNLSILGRRVPGARLCFRTNSTKFIVHIFYKKLEVDIGLSIFQCQSGAVFIGDRPTSRYAGLVYPKSYNDSSARGTFIKSDEIEDVLIYLPRNPEITNVCIEVEDQALMLPPTPYRYQKPILYYGSSITECGAALVSNGYTSIISRWLDVDFYNFGFSGNAKGEPEIAEYINKIEKSIFVFDYDHNAPDVAHLNRTHENFFKIIRKYNPDLPIVMLTRPAFSKDSDNVARYEVVLRTYENAVSAGDNNVYFIDGQTFFDEENIALCTIDTIHPNDLGFYYMAKKICPVIHNILKNGNQYHL